MFTLIAYPSGVVVEAVVLAVASKRMRVVPAGFTDSMELIHSNDQWHTEEGERVELEFLLALGSRGQIEVPLAALAASATAAEPVADDGDCSPSAVREVAEASLASHSASDTLSSSPAHGPDREDSLLDVMMAVAELRLRHGQLNDAISDLERITLRRPQRTEQPRRGPARKTTGEEAPVTKQLGASARPRKMSAGAAE